MTFQSHSQAGQDQWVWEMLEHKTDGFYLDLGCNDAEKHSNSKGLEDVGWSGILVDIVGGCENRKGTFILSDAANPNDRLKLYYSHLPAVVDFASIDTDDATLGTIAAMPWNSVTFRLICLEHDCYRIGPKVRDETRDILQQKGYSLVCSDVMISYPEGAPLGSFEDWWIYSPLINPDLRRRFRSQSLFWKDILAK